MQYSTVQYSTVQYIYTVLTVQYNTIVEYDSAGTYITTI